jgi:hypothetical protein
MVFSVKSIFTNSTSKQISIGMLVIAVAAKIGVVAHKGGLGSQLFQWTFAHSLLSVEKHKWIHCTSMHPFKLRKLSHHDLLEPLRQMCNRNI